MRTLHALSAESTGQAMKFIFGRDAGILYAVETKMCTRPQRSQKRRLRAETPWESRTHKV